MSFCPGALLDADVSWEAVDRNTVKGTLEHDGITVSAVLTIDDEGKLINFLSQDRYAAGNDGSYENIPWSTPVYEYKKINGLMLPSDAEAVWHYEDGDFAYVRLGVRDLVINP
ncbi:MAG: hypothetical protein PQJ58_01960 [Spirochaetales bacterium]|nr:hypothetical protein [Spirochaetales bacterium]